MSHAEESHESVSTGHGKDQQPGRWPVHLMKAIWLACMIIVVVTKCSSDDKPKKDGPDYNPGAIYDQDYSDYHIGERQEMELEGDDWVEKDIPDNLRLRTFPTTNDEPFLRLNICTGVIDTIGGGREKKRGPGCDKFKYHKLYKDIVVPFKYLKKS